MTSQKRTGDPQALSVPKDASGVRFEAKGKREDASGVASNLEL